MAGWIAQALLLDVNSGLARSLAASLGQGGLRAQHVGSGSQALEALREKPFDAVVTDLKMPGMDGMELLREVSALWPEVAVVMITAHGTIPAAVEAMKAGAADFVLKPFDREEILYAIRKAVIGARQRGAEPAAPAAGEADLVGTSPVMLEVIETIRRAAGGNATVLIRGE